MNFEITPLNDVNPIIKDVPIERTFLSVVKPENVSGSTLVLQTPNGEFMIKEYDLLTKSEWKHQGYTKAFFISEEMLKLEYKLVLFSDEQIILMETILKCQIKVNNPKEIAKLNRRNISNDVYDFLSDTIGRTIFSSSSMDVLNDINNIFQTIANACKKVELDYVTIHNCIQTDTVITEEARRVREKSKVISSIRDKDLYDMATFKDKITDMHDMADLLQERQLATLEAENRRYELLRKRYEELKDSRLIPADLSMSEFMRQMEKLDPDFGSKQLVISENDDEIPAEPVKSYFED